MARVRIHQFWYIFDCHALPPQAQSGRLNFEHLRVAVSSLAAGPVIIVWGWVGFGHCAEVWPCWAFVRSRVPVKCLGLLLSFGEFSPHQGHNMKK